VYGDETEEQRVCFRLKKVSNSTIIATALAGILICGVVGLIVIKTVAKTQGTQRCLQSASLR
jgi:hypothetical protein